MGVNKKLYDNFVKDFSYTLREKIQNLELSKIIFLCVGTDRVTGDAFGPLVGYKLENLFKGNDNIEIIGTLEKTICMQNISYILNSINKTNENNFFIAIDAAVSNKSSLGRIIVSQNKMNIGKSIGRRNIYVGDLSIKGVVSRNLNNPQKNFRLLQNTSLNLIMNMADLVSIRNI